MTHSVCEQSKALSQGLYINTGNGPVLIPMDIKHPEYMALINPDNAFWSLVKKEALAETLADKQFLDAYKLKTKQFDGEINKLRFDLPLSAVYVNITARCNLNCSYCYIPEEMRSSGPDMSKDDLLKALKKLNDYFKAYMPEGRKPQIIFHGAEPLLCKDALFTAIEKFQADFRFGIQTNGLLLDDETAEFIKETGTGLGLSLDAPYKEIADKTRKTWTGDSVFEKTLLTMERLKGYPAYNVICTVTKENMSSLTDMVDFFHSHEVPAVLMNMLRCTLPPSRNIKPVDHEVAKYFIAALDRSHELYRSTGRKLIVGNFANILVSILAPMARRLMCDISPCGGGRVFFALAPDGGMFPCSEFIGLPEFRGGNLFTDNIDEVLKTEAFTRVTERIIEKIDPCKSCVIRHYCGAPCPAESHEMNHNMHTTGAFCEFYEEQTRYAFRLIADGIYEDYLWDEWDKDTEVVFDYQH